MDLKTKYQIKLLHRFIVPVIVITMPLFFGIGAGALQAKAKKESSEKAKKTKKEKKLSSADLKLQAEFAKANNKEVDSSQQATEPSGDTSSGDSTGEATNESDETETGTSKTVALPNKAETQKTDSSNTKSQTIRPESERVSFWGTLFKTLLVLGLISAALFYGIRFFAKKQGFQPLSNDMVETLARVSLQPGKHMHIVEVGGRVLVLGVTEQSINLLSQVEDSDWIDDLKMARSRNAAQPTPNFWSQFTDQFVSHFGSSGPKEQKPSGPGLNDLIEKQRSRLQKLRSEGDS